MIHDNLINAKNYYNISEKIKIALEFLEKTDLKNIDNGKHNILGDDEIYVNVQEYRTKVSDNIEAHKKYIDIQYMISGEENIGVSNINDVTSITQYDASSDVMFFKGNTSLIKLKENEFVIFYPDDAHLPCQIVDIPANVKKAVVKIKI